MIARLIRRLAELRSRGEGGCRLETATAHVFTQAIDRAGVAGGNPTQKRLRIK